MGDRNAMSVHIIRLARLYNNPEVKEQQPDPKTGRGGRKARPAQKGIFGVGKTKLFEDIIFRTEDDPLIPGTDVPRLRLVYLGPKAKGATDSEIARVAEGLQRFDAKLRRMAG
jgi:hypothetical protein